MDKNKINKIKDTEIRHLIKAKQIDWQTNKDSNKHIIGFYAGKTKNGIDGMMICDIDETGNIIPKTIIGIDSATIQTCTGRKDKNGIYVWEKDKIKTNTNKTGVIEYEHGTYVAKMENTTIPLANLKKTTFEVIDETYDHTFEKMIAIINNTTEKKDCIEAIRNLLHENKINDKPYKIGDYVYYLERINETPQIIFGQIGMAANKGRIEHIYRDENNNYKIELETQNGNHVFMSEEKLTQETFKTLHDLLQFYQNI